LFPDLYVKIQNQIISKDEQLIINNQEATTDVGIMGGNTVVFPFIAENSFGIELFGFFCEMTWYWDTTKITSVIPSTYGECYAPGITYEGLTQNSEYFKDNNTAYYKYVKGHFTASISGNPLKNYYPWHEITVRKDGTYSWKWY
jgi:hypothetical protein